MIPALHALHGTAPVVGAPSWHPWMLGGIPTEALPAMPRYPLNPAWLLPAETALPVFLGIHLALAALGAFAFARRAGGASRAGAALAAMVYAFGGALWMRGMHPENVAIAAWLPLLLAAVRETAAAATPARRRRGAAGIALVTAAMLLVGGGAPLLLLAALACAWAFVDARPARIVEAAAWCAGGAALGAIAGLPGLGPMIETASLAARGGLTLGATDAFALEPRDLLRLWVPDSAGTVEAGTIAWPHYVERWVYFGLLPLPLVVLGGRGKRSLLVGLALTGVLALGVTGVLHAVLYAALPPYRLFRAPARWVIVAGLFAGTLAGRGLDRLLYEDRALAGLFRAPRWQAWLAAIPGLAAAAALAAALLGARPASSYWTAAAFGALATGWYWAANRWRAHPALPAAALAIVACDLLAPALRAPRPVPASWSSAPPLFRAAADAAGGARVAHSDEVRQTDASWYPYANGSRWGYRNTRGYSQLVPSLYSHVFGEGLNIFGGPSKPDAAALRLLGVGAWIGSTAPDGFVEVARDGDLAVWRAPEPFVAAVVGETYFVPPGNEAAARTASLATDPRVRAVVFEPIDTRPGTAEVLQRSPGEITLRADAPEGGLLVVAEAWHPRWRATIDGARAPILRADSIWQAVLLPPGSHEVVFHCRPAVPLVAWLLSLAALAAALLLLLTPRRPSRPRSRTSPAGSASNGS